MIVPIKATDLLFIRMSGWSIAAYYFINQFQVIIYTNLPCQILTKTDECDLIYRQIIRDEISEIYHNVIINKIARVSQKTEYIDWKFN